MAFLSRVLRSAFGFAALKAARQIPCQRILTIGVYLNDRPNLAIRILNSLQSEKHEVVHRWISLGSEDPPSELRTWTIAHTRERAPKFRLLNETLRDVSLSDFDYLLVSDDDVEYPRGFIDTYIGMQFRLRWALAQPAQTYGSNIDHAITLEKQSAIARRTRFVEIGPVFSMDRAAMQILVPFNEEFGMGYGLDFVWPVLLQQRMLKMGIVDAAPIHNRFRQVAVTYQLDAAMTSLQAMLARYPHLTRTEAGEILKTHRIWF